MKGFDAGKLRNSITIQKDTPTRDGYGAEVASWSTHASRWAWIQPLNGSEKYVSQQIQAITTHQITIRFATGVLPKMRVLFGTRVFDIVQVLDLEEKGTELKLVCKELI